MKRYALHRMCQCFWRTPAFLSIASRASTRAAASRSSFSRASASASISARVAKTAASSARASKQLRSRRRLLLAFEHTSSDVECTSMYELPKARRRRRPLSSPDDASRRFPSRRRCGRRRPPMVSSMLSLTSKPTWSSAASRWRSAFARVASASSARVSRGASQRYLLFQRLVLHLQRASPLPVAALAPAGVASIAPRKASASRAARRRAGARRLQGAGRLAVPPGRLGRLDAILRRERGEVVLRE